MLAGSWLSACYACYKSHEQETGGANGSQSEQTGLELSIDSEWILLVPYSLRGFVRHGSLAERRRTGAPRRPFVGS